jgi:uncharacterized protein
MPRPFRTIRVPFVRDEKRDFANLTGAAAISAVVRHVLLSEGEMPWRPELRGGLERVRHQTNTDVLEELARLYATDALTRWAPGLQVTSLQAQRKGERLALRLSVGDGQGSTGEAEVIA